MTEKECGDDPLYKLSKKMEMAVVHTFLTGKKARVFWNNCNIHT